jgi:alkanesulfonate monooxygenase SsuD/methylene tetrahydromethanopterin reductase-like flavin-dependent oxidoreductase (luciferase family)
MTPVQFGWIAPVIGVPESGGQSIILQEHENGVLSAVNEYFDSIWAADHFYGFDRIDDAYLECWTSLTWVAAAYPKLLIGALVMCNNYRHPAVVAHMAKTLQAFSHGRLIFGYGAGWREQEYERHGFPFEAPAVRIRQLDEALQIIKSMWTQPRTTFNGTYYQVRDLPCEPKPTPVPPILIGGSGEKLMLRLVARHADWWNSGAAPDVYARKLSVLQQHCADVGRDFNSIVKTVQIELPPPTDATTTKQTIDRLRQYTDLGVSHLMLDFGVVKDPDVVRRIGEDVLATFR